MVSELKHFSVRRGVLGWSSLEEAPGTLSSSLPNPWDHRDECPGSPSDVWQEDKVQWQAESRDILSEYLEPVYHEESSIRPGHSTDVVHLHPWRFSRLNYSKTMKNLVWPHIWPVFEQEVGLEMSRDPFPPLLSYDPMIWFIEASGSYGEYFVCLIRYKEKNFVETKEVEEANIVSLQSGQNCAKPSEMCELRVEMIIGSAYCVLTVLSPRGCLEIMIICAQHCIFLAHEFFGTLYNSSIQLYLKVVFVLFFVEFIGLTWKLTDFSYLSKCDVFFVENCEAE